MAHSQVMKGNAAKGNASAAAIRSVAAAMRSTIGRFDAAGASPA
jgi:hypothetical protein